MRPAADPTGTAADPTDTAADPTGTAEDPAARPATPTGPAAPAGPAEVLDCLGQRCPLPVIALARRLPGLPAGAVLRVLADDPAAGNDIAAWCRMRGHDFLGAVTVEGRPGVDVRRRA